MKKFLKNCFICLMVMFCCFLTACSSSNNNSGGDDGNNTGNAGSSNKYITISITNVSQYFDIDVEIERTYGYVVYYNLKVRLIGNYRLTTDVKFTIKSEIKFDYQSKYSKQTGTTKETDSLTMTKGTNYVSKKCSGSINKKVDDCYNIRISSLMYSASGTILNLN